MTTPAPTVEQAIAALESQEQRAPEERDQQVILGALSILDATGHADVLGWTGKVAFMLGEMTGEDVTIDELRTLLRGAPSAADVSAAEPPAGGVTPLTDDQLGELAGVTGGPPPVPGDDEQERPRQPPFIGGMPDDFRAQVEFTGMPGDIGQGAGSTRQTVGVAPRYRLGDQWAHATKSGREIRRIQKDLERAGLLERGTYTPGFWDQATANGYEQAMAYANTQGSSAEQVIEEMAALGRGERAKVQQFIPPDELKPDPASISQRVKGWFKDRLGREPTDAEMAEFAGYLSGQYGAAHDVSVDQARADFARGEFGAVAESLSGDPDERAGWSQFFAEAFGAAASAPMTFTAVDPEARAMERFEDRFGPEIDRLAALPEVRENMDNIFASLRTMGNMVGR